MQTSNLGVTQMRYGVSNCMMETIVGYGHNVNGCNGLEHLSVKVKIKICNLSVHYSMR